MSEEKTNFVIGCGTILFIVLIILFASSFRTIKSGEVGLRVRYGKIIDSSLTEGVNWKIPFIEKIVKVNIKVQKTELNTEASTKDLQIINTTIAVNYRVDVKKASSLYKTVGNKYEETILQPAIKESVKNAIAQFNAEEITTNRGTVSASCLETIQEKVKKYGIVIEDFNLTNFTFSQEYTKAIEEKQVAQQNLEKAKLEAEKKITEAQATADANKLLEQTLTDKILKQKFIDKWNGELSKVTNGNTIFDISSLIGE